jgi:hypothetical protein
VAPLARWAGTRCFCAAALSVGTCSGEFVYELVYIRAVFCESTCDYRLHSTQLAQSASYWPFTPL